MKVNKFDLESKHVIKYFLNTFYDIMYGFSIKSKQERWQLYIRRTNRTHSYI